MSGYIKPGLISSAISKELLKYKALAYRIYLFIYYFKKKKTFLFGIAGRLFVFAVDVGAAYRKRSFFFLMSNMVIVKTPHVHIYKVF